MSDEGRRALFVAYFDRPAVEEGAPVGAAASAAAAAAAAPSHQPSHLHRRSPPPPVAASSPAASVTAAPSLQPPHLHSRSAPPPAAAASPHLPLPAPPHPPVDDLDSAPSARAGRLPFRSVTETTTFVEGRAIKHFHCSCHYQTAMLLPCRHVLYLMVLAQSSAFELLSHCGQRWWRADRAHVLADIARKDNEGPLDVVTILSTRVLKPRLRATPNEEEIPSTSSRPVSEAYRGLRRREQAQTLMCSLSAALAHDSVDPILHAEVSHRFGLRRQFMRTSALNRFKSL